jgi:uncharacterized protein
MSTAVLMAVALLLVLEGLPLLLAPARWREVIQRVARLADGQLRFFGLVMVVLGASLLFYSGRA